MKNIAILGSTGSIGVNTLKVIESFPDKFRVIALSSFSNTDILSAQIRRFKPRYVTIADPSKAAEFARRHTAIHKVNFFSDIDGLNIIASLKEVDIVVIAISGSSAVYPLLKSIEAKKHICLANKESIVMAGDVIMETVKRKKARLIPVDSEHSAIFQCIHSSDNQRLNRIFLTGSGGPLRNLRRDKFSSVKISHVLRHPKWKMGRKITVDSATLMNKGLEIIEAKHLFGISVDSIEVLIHPEAIVHSMVEFIDGSIIAQLGPTDMRLPIQYALTYPIREKAILPRIDFSNIKNLTFKPPDTKKYPCLSLAMMAVKLGRTYPAVLSAADEEAVKAFLGHRIAFIKIPAIIEKVLLKHRAVSSPGLNDIFEADRWARQEVCKLC